MADTHPPPLMGRLDGSKTGEPKWQALKARLPVRLQAWQPPSFSHLL